MATKRKTKILLKKGSESGEMSDSLRSVLQKGSETAFEYTCDVCRMDNKYVEATGYCTNCSDYLCQECYSYHLKPKPSQHHILLDQRRMPKDVSQRQSKDMCTEQCAVHKHKNLKYYCAEHCTFSCSECIRLGHYNCEGVDYIPDIAGDVLISREYTDMTLKVKSKKTTAVHVADICVREEGDSYKPWNTGSVVLPGDKLVIVDRINYTVKLINLQSNKVVSHLKYGQRIWDITAITNTRVAVTSPGDNTILFINVTNTLTIDHEVKVKGQCHGIASIGDDRFVITYDDPVKVEIISRIGELLQTVVTEDKGRQLFSSPNYVAVSPDQQTIYISDTSRQTVTCLDLSGQVKATFEDDYLNYPRGLTADRDGVLYVCDYWYNNIHRLTPDLHKIQILLQESDGIMSPDSVSFNEEQNKLYIGMMYNDIVQVYQLH